MQRYYEKSYSLATAPGTSTDVGAAWHAGTTGGDGTLIATIRYQVAKRIEATPTYYSNGGTSGSWAYQRNGASGEATVTHYASGTQQTVFYTVPGAGGWAAARMYGHFVVNADY